MPSTVGGNGRRFIRNVAVEKIAHRAEIEILEQLSHSAFAFVQIVVMAKTGCPADIYARLSGIQFSGLKIKHERFAVGLVCTCQSGSTDGIRIEAEIAFAGDRRV